MWWLDSTVVLLPLRFSRGEPRGLHARKHTHSLITTQTRVDGDIRHSIVNSPNGRFVYVVVNHTAPAWRNKAFEQGTHAEREGKFKFRAYWNFREQKDHVLGDVSA